MYGTSSPHPPKLTPGLTPGMAPPEETKFVYRSLAGGGYCLGSGWKILFSKRPGRVVLSWLRRTIRTGFAGSAEYQGPPVASMALRVRSRPSFVCDEASAASTSPDNGRAMGRNAGAPAPASIWFGENCHEGATAAVGDRVACHCSPGPAHSRRPVAQVPHLPPPGARPNGWRVRCNETTCQRIGLRNGSCPHEA